MTLDFIASAVIGGALLAILVILVVLAATRPRKHIQQIQQQPQQAGVRAESVPRIADVFVLDISKDTAVMYRVKPDAGDPHLLVGGGKAFYVKDVKPLILIKKTPLGVRGSMLYLWSDNKPLEVDGERAVAKEVNPEILGTLLETKIFKKISRAVGGLDIGGLLLGVGLGAMLCFFMLFVVLPMMNVPVTIGRQPVEVVVHQTQPASAGTLPPPGNFTVGP